MTRRLKVFRTSTGFHDAYVAAPSRKAALAAWGASNDLFAIGAAELVTDPEMTAEPLQRPGEVVRRPRGDEAAQLDALESAGQARRTRPAAPAPRSRQRSRPNRERLDKMEAAVRDFETKAQAQIAVLTAREDEIRREREAMTRRHDLEAGKLDRQLRKTRDAYERALRAWRQEA